MAIKDARQKGLEKKDSRRLKTSSRSSIDGSYLPRTNSGFADAHSSQIQRILFLQRTLGNHSVDNLMRLPKTIQRRIVVAGRPYTPTAKYYRYLNRNFGSHMKEFIKTMHNNGNPPDFSFSSYSQMGYEVRVRHQAVKGIETAHRGCCHYPDSAHPDHLDSTYWDRVGWMRFKPKSPLPPGKKASDAIEAIFAPGAGTRLECMAMTVAVEYYSLLKGLGKAKFNARFPAGAGLEISTRLSGGTHPTFYGATRLYENITISSSSDLLPGDWVYFKNFADYLIRHPGGAWQGENAIYLGGGKFRGFGVRELTETGMNAELVRVYNNGLPAAARKTTADLAAEGGGLKMAPVFRPDIAKLSP
jgi:protein-glutamine gamma-glutamyltransferase